MDSYDLTVLAVTETDSGTYYCAITTDRDEIKRIGSTITRVLMIGIGLLTVFICIGLKIRPSCKMFMIND